MKASVGEERRIQLDEIDVGHEGSCQRVKVEEGVMIGGTNTSSFCVFFLFAKWKFFFFFSLR